MRKRILDILGEIEDPKVTDLLVTLQEKTDNHDLRTDIVDQCLEIYKILVHIFLKNHKRKKGKRT